MWQSHHISVHFRHVQKWLNDKVAVTTNTWGWTLLHLFPIKAIHYFYALEKIGYSTTHFHAEGNSFHSATHTSAYIYSNAVYQVNSWLERVQYKTSFIKKIHQQSMLLDKKDSW